MRIYDRDALLAHDVEPSAARMGFVFEIPAASFGEDSDYLPWRHKVFEAGRYPAQGVEADIAYLDRMVRNFRPVKFKNSHTPDPQSVFSRIDLGGADRLYRDGNDLIAEGRRHRILTMLPEVPRASVEIENKDTDPRLSAIAVLNFPQVPDAMIAAFGISREDATKDPEANDSPIAAEAALSQFHDPARASAPAKEIQMTQSTWDKIRAIFGRMKPEALKEAGLTADEVRSLQPLDPDIESEIRRLRDQNEAQEARFAAINAARLKDRAELFARSWRDQKKILPAEESHVASLYMMAARADGEGRTAHFGADGAVTEGEHVKALAAAMEARRTLAIFETEIANEAPKGIQADRIAVAQRTLAGATDAYNRGGRN